MKVIWRYVRMYRQQMTINPTYKSKTIFNFRNILDDEYIHTWNYGMMLPGPQIRQTTRNRTFVVDSKRITAAQSAIWGAKLVYTALQNMVKSCSGQKTSHMENHGRYWTPSHLTHTWHLIECFPFRGYRIYSAILNNAPSHPHRQLTAIIGSEKMLNYDRWLEGRQLQYITQSTVEYIVFKSPTRL